MIIQQAELIPDWLKKDLDDKCPFCGSLYEVGYSPNGKRVTKHYCPNKECSETIVSKMVFVWNILKVDGIKEGRSRELVKNNKIKHHLEAIPLVLKNKPRIDLTTYMRLNCIQGIDTTWDKICFNKNSLDEVLNSNDIRGILDIEDVNNAKKYISNFDIVYPNKPKHESILNISIMMTGDILGFEPRELLVVAMNKKYNGLLNLGYSKSIRKTGIFALVKDPKSSVTNKVSVALDCGIPIMSPEEFIIKVDKLIREKVGDNYEF
jgi:hypothetical protein